MIVLDTQAADRAELESSTTYTYMRMPMPHADHTAR